MHRLVPRFLALVFCLSPAASFLAAGDPVDPASGDAVPSVPELASQGYKLAFSDEFNGTSVDEDKWLYRTDSKASCTELAANVTESDGVLHVAVKKEDAGGKHYTGGGIISKTEFLYGYYEARFKMPAGKGWHTSFYTEHWNGKDTTATHGREEIDICESESQSVPFKGYIYTFHDWGSKLLPKGSFVPPPTLPPGHAKPPAPKTPVDLHDFHIWGMEFTPKVINFYFDGELRGSIDATLFKHTPMSILMTSLGFVGHFDDSKLPSSADFDYVRYFTKPQTDTTPPSP